MIRSIICFNGGSAGDLLRALCLDQIDPIYYQHQSSGAVDLSDEHFKTWSRDQYHRISSDLDFSRIRPIENSHYWLDCYPDLAQTLFYIDYPDTLQSVILQTVKRKRYQDSWQIFIDKNLEYFPQKKLADRLTVQTAETIYNILWLKNLQGWRQNRHLQRLDFSDFLYPNRMSLVVSRVLNHDIIDRDKFNRTHQRWLADNQQLCEQALTHDYH